jgi:hypothetical protein
MIRRGLEPALDAWRRCTEVRNRIQSTVSCIAKQWSVGKLAISFETWHDHTPSKCGPWVTGSHGAKMGHAKCGSCFQEVANECYDYQDAKISSGALERTSGAAAQAQVLGDLCECVGWCDAESSVVSAHQ